jgi:peptidyl-prolyl cis-trans isomerase C
MRRLACFLLALAAAVVACSRGKKANLDLQHGSSPVSGLTSEQAAQVLARVGDRPITVGDFVTALEHMDQFDRMRYQSAERRQELLEEMIDIMLLADEAREKGYDKDPLTQQELREILRDAMLKTAQEGVPGPGAIPEDEVRTYYETHKADFHDPQRRRVSAIILTGDASTAGSVLEAAKKATGTQWGDLVRAKSSGTQAKDSAQGSANAGVPADLAGDLGFVSPPGDPRGANSRVPEEVRSAVFEIQNVGEVLPHLVRVRGQYYVVKLTSKTESHDRTLEEADRSIRVKLARDKMRAREEALVDELRRKYPVQIDETALGEVRVELPPDAGP